MLVVWFLRLDSARRWKRVVRGRWRMVLCIVEAADIAFVAVRGGR